MKKLIYIFFITFLLNNYLLLSQNDVNKVGGIGFRVDDSIYDYPNTNTRLRQLVDLFNSRGLNFTYAVNFGLNYSSPALLSYLTEMQDDGFEIADHTPEHETRFFYAPVSDRSLYSGRNGVDHIIQNVDIGWPTHATMDKICLKFNNVNLNTVTGEGTININGNDVTCNTNNEFNTLKVSSTQYWNRMNVIYVPSINKLFKFDAINVSGNNIYNIRSFWDEDNVNLSLSGVQYHIMGLYDVFYPADALRAMALVVQRRCEANGINPPTTWVQPGGYHPQFYRADIKDALESMGYTSAGVFADPVPPIFNSYDPEDDKKYAINWGDFDEESQTLSDIKKNIADHFAKHYVTIGHSHLLRFNPEKSFSDYLQRTDDILEWCLANGIPVKTYNEWANILYETEQNPYVNVMPSPEVDLDGDGDPDGFYDYANISSDGVDGNFTKSFHIFGNGTLCSIVDLAGVEKGENYFGLWIKGQGSIQVIFNPDQWQQHTFTSNSDEWNYYSCTFQVPTTSSVVTDLIINSVSTSGTIKVGGLELRKNSSSSIIPPFLNELNWDSNNNAVDLTWEDNSSNESNYRVRRMFQYENVWSTIIDNLSANTEVWTDNLLDFPESLKLLPQVEVYYEIQAYIGGTYSASNVQSITIEPINVYPVELSLFKARYNNNKVELNWRTETEVNNYGFEIQKCTEPNAKSDKSWTKIGFVQGNGNSNSPKEYSFIDDKPNGANKLLYRLKQIDNDGQFSISEEVEVEVIPSIYSLEQNYPNPFNPSTKIGYQIPVKGNVTIKLFNSLGQEIETILDEEKDPGNYELEFNSFKLSSGVYFYRLESGAFVSTKKMIVLK